MNDETFTSRVRVQSLLNELRKDNEHLLTLDKYALTTIATERLLKISMLDKLVLEKSDDELDKLLAETVSEQE
jgi:spore coat polysaccharide biosynthesis protein SpsF (cytidylyltransferase family)